MSEAIKEQSAGSEQTAAESQGAKNGQQEAKPGNQSAGTSEQEGGAKSETVSRAEYNKLQADLADFKKVEEERKVKEKKRQEELLKEQGKYKDLYDAASKENEAMKAQLAKLTDVMKGMLEEELKSLPEDFDKTIIPPGEPYDQVVWLRKAKPVFVASKTEGRRGDGTPPAGGNGGLVGMRSIYTHPTSPKH